MTDSAFISNDTLPLIYILTPQLMKVWHANSWGLLHFVHCSSPPLSIFILKIYGVAKWIKNAMLLYILQN